MNRKTSLACIFVALLCLLNSGCFSIEQEIFMEPDGSGDLVIYFSMPDIPEAMKKNAASPQDPQKLIEDIKRKFATELPPTIKLKDAKEIQRHGAIAYYIVLHFNRLDDVNSMLGKISKESLSKNDQSQATDSKAPSKDESSWNVQLEKAGDRTVITQSFYADIMGAMGGAMGGAPGMDKPPSAKAPSDPAPHIVSVEPNPAPKPGARRATRRTAPSAKPAAQKVAPKEENPFENMADGAMKGLMDEETINTLVSSIFKLRFILHAPKTITETNADIVLNGNIAIWNASFGAFTKEKKPIEMKVAY
jgi:hypothetical protein